MKIQVISEDDLLEMIRTLPGDETATTSKSTTPKLKRKVSSTVSKSTEESPAKVQKTSSTVSKSADPSSSKLPKASDTDSNLLCKNLFGI